MHTQLLHVITETMCNANMHTTALQQIQRQKINHSVIWLVRTLKTNKRKSCLRTAL